MLFQSAGVIGAVTAGLSQLGTAEADDSPVCPTDFSEQDEDEDKDEDEDDTVPDLREERFTIQEGTSYATDAFVRESSTDGPTAVVFGGLHGNETAGHRAAARIADWEPVRGTLVVVPEANAVAVERSTRVSPNGDLNRQFPADEEPTTPLARELWEIVEEFDADVVLDLHTSRGIWNSDVGPTGFGQAVFPTEAGRPIADEAIQGMNEFLHSGKPGHYTFTRGNTLTGARPMLIHKVGNDLDRPGFLLEATQHGTDLETRTAWLEELTARILRQTGVEV
ncbi:thioredoxin [Natronococcus pandeyae]|uniref:Thioredoxin n=1 Tax=Natronococcus pandeyae TaxID=2055836 RepID=A0A8J8Q0E5_9EURY|nr:succinylglutamate desuccinylase/aspartoacylase family protein [Natronococcus pandeyae]TYL37835.1 thioredoxin [Natronococcus pandeyae]